MKYFRSMIIRAALALIVVTAAIGTAHAQEICHTTTYTTTTVYYYSDGTIAVISWSQTVRICMPYDPA